MSKIVNTEGIKPGVIYRIALENFVTYRQVELYPGPSLNMIIGPNGTGKSTFVCAIILGLCGKTSVIGRAKKISEYVRSGCQQATVEIELYRAEGQRNVIITRTFNLQDVTNWYIDKKTVREKQVQDLIATMNIQVDNLCQLLPQDRVQDFSKLNPQELLRSTLAAAGGARSVIQLDELIETRNKQRGLTTKLQNNAQALQEQERLNERLKIQIDAMQQRKDIENQIQVCEKKKLWLEYQELRERVIEKTNDKKNAVKLVNTHRTRMAPLEKFIADAKIGIGKVEKQKLMAGREIHTFRDKANELIKSVRDNEYVLKEIETSFQEKLERHRNLEQDLREAKVKLDKLNTDKVKLQEKVGDESRVKMETAEVMKALSKTNAAMDGLKKQKLEVQYDLENNIMPQIRLYQNNIQNLENVDNKRLETLRQHSPDAYKAVCWLRENKHLFEHEVYEPMMLEINFKDKKFARYLENCVSARDLVAFTFESARDMNLFLSTVRRDLGLRRVNALCSPPGPNNVPKTNIQQISYLGFYTYVVDTLSAPAPVLRYLCRNYRIHQIPIGNDHTYKNSDKVPNNINLYFTENHRFSVRVSAYSGAVSSSTSEIRDARLLMNTVDVERLSNYNNQLENFEAKSQSHNSKIQALNEKISTVEVSLNELNVKRRNITDGVERLRTISAQIRLQAKKVSDIETSPSLNVEQEKARCKRKQREAVLKQCAMQNEIVQVMKNLQERQLNGDVWKQEKALCKRKQREAVLKQCAMQNEIVQVMKNLQERQLNGDVWKVKLEFSRNTIVQQESELRDLRNELNSVQSTLETIESSLNRAKSNAKEKLVEAKRSCNNKLPQDADFPYKQQFDCLPADVTALVAHCYELQTRIECMEQGDEQIIKEYEERERLITKLRTDVNSSSDSNKLLEDQLKRLSETWLPPLLSLLEHINKRFGDMFAKLGCAGEVKLDRAGADEDYDKYGISVLVSFRSSEQLQQLTRHAQSGGERALSTATYLLALQALTAVPFRCVDEINQGMDPINERKMFQLLVKVTTDSDNAQYFLLTPKLLTSLEYNEKIMVHTIMNGRQIMNYRKWNYDKFLQKAQHNQM